MAKKKFAAGVSLWPSAMALPLWVDTPWPVPTFQASNTVGPVSLKGHLWFLSLLCSMTLNYWIV